MPPRSLDIFLHGEKIGIIAKLPGDQFLLSFEELYIADVQRPTISLSFTTEHREFLPPNRTSAHRLPVFFSNLLPEGALKEFLAAKAGVKSGSEFELLKLLGSDLPGAVTVQESGAFYPADTADQVGFASTDSGLLKFSLAGVQLKFSAIMRSSGRLTIPADGQNGSWIVKVPSAHFPAVPENEFVIMELARRVGINVPETMLIPVTEIDGLPKEFKTLKGNALAINRFDRRPDGERVHIEDFAQVLGVYPANKYKGHNYENIARILAERTNPDDVAEFIQRLTFSVLTGNGDMHLKNWSLIYPDKITPQLSPAYDLLSTLPYISSDSLALNFGKSRDLGGVSRFQIRRFAEKTNLPVEFVWNMVANTAEKVHSCWKKHDVKHLLPNELLTVIDKQIKSAAATTK